MGCGVATNLQWRTVTEPTLAPAQPGSAPAGVSHPKTIKSFVRRAGRTTTGQAKAFEDFGPRYVLPYAPAPLDAPAAFGRTAPLVLEIGFGRGEATAHIARVRPDDNFLCCEVHEPGVGALQQDLARRVVGQVFAAHDVGDALRGVVHHHGQLVGPQAVGPAQHEVTHGLGHVLLLRSQTAVMPVQGVACY